MAYQGGIQVSTVGIQRGIVGIDIGRGIDGKVREGER
jgi:hypothetical protein